MRLIGYLYRSAWRQMVLVSFGSVAAGLAGAALIAVIGKAVVGDGDRTTLAAWFFTLCVVTIVTKSLSEVALLRLSQTKILDLRLSLSRKLIATPQRQLQAIGKDELMVIMTRDIDSFSSALQVLPRVFSNMVVIIASMAYMAWLSWQTLLMFIACMVVCVGGYLVAERRPVMQLARAREQAQHLQASVRNLIEGSRELQLNAMRSGHFLDSVLGRMARDYAAMFVSSMSKYTWYSNTGNILFYQGIAVLLFVAPFIYAAPSAITATLVLVMLYVIRPLGDSMFAMPLLRQADIALDRVMRLHGRLTDGEPGVRSTGAFGKDVALLELRDVEFGYRTADGDHFELGPISLRIAQGEILFVIGGNGTGKTTLAMLLLGLFEPEGGEIVLNGVPVTDRNREEYRQMFSAIFADGHLFEHLPFPERPEIHRAAERHLRNLGLPDRVSIEDGRFSTITVSTGQRKRLSLVSSYLEDRPIYVFDEWAADQDPEFKRVFYTHIAPELKAKGKAVVIISHDDTYFHCADRLIRLDSGRLRCELAA